jgi:hypothetical protein
MTMKGLFQLQSAHDLLAKLRHDYGRLREAPNDPYVAFDFFATAEHLLDWVYPGSLGRASRTAERDSHLILQVVSHLATGAKHMVPEDRRHLSVQHADVAPSTYGLADGTGTYGSSHLVVNLEGAAAAELGMAATPLKLATRALQYWEDHSHFK